MTEKRPNVVVCLCDQLRAMDVGCYGSDFVKTPNIDALAKQGVRFDIACSNNPVCTPGGRYCSPVCTAGRAWEG